MTAFIFGEAMLEYHSHGGSGLRYSGDTLNTAIHLARAGHEVAYVTAVGTDPISDALVAAWGSEGIDTRHVLRHPSRSPGIYAIHLDHNGERSFLYWRDRSAAREMFELDGAAEALAAAEQAQLLYYSHITLAIASEPGCAALLDLARGRKAAGRAVAYDSNFRPALWPDLRPAQALSKAAMEAATLGLPTNGDERDLWQTGEDDEAIAQRWLDAELDIVAVKAAEKGCVVGSRNPHSLRRVDAQLATVVDTSGAGDAFNGGFLAGWLSGSGVIECVENGQRLARRTIGHQGAVRLG